MRDFFIDYVLIILAGVVIGAFVTYCVMQFTDSPVMTFGAAWTISFLFGFFVYPLIADFLRG